MHIHAIHDTIICFISYGNIRVSLLKLSIPEQNTGQITFPRVNLWMKCLCFEWINLLLRLQLSSAWWFLQFSRIYLAHGCHQSPRQSLYSLRRRLLMGIRMPIINLRRSDDRLRFIMGIPIQIKKMENLITSCNLTWVMFIVPAHVSLARPNTQYKIHSVYN